MTIQDQNNHESLRRPEISLLSERAKLRKLIVPRSADQVKSAFKQMDPVHKGDIHHTVSAWAKRPDWSVKSDFLSPIVQSDHTESDLQQISDVVTDGTLKLDEVLSESANDLYVDSLRVEDSAANIGAIDEIRNSIIGLYDERSLDEAA